ncbi:hypothetical protein DM02DRAFT_608142 [Periconia macrospinosa]|uniref:Uncharacterized protein n=1 Tax=Periconia macrospinosa TaxID=97972 RepID=A0A2V1EF08_9PLEO|nr:hypothetical protein DM02DRAFT_608142 [Periconia macrospinosa]
MSALDPSGPSQPTLDQAYTTPGNPASKNPSETSQINAQAHNSTQPIDKRIPATQSTDVGHEGQPSALGKGIRGAPSGEEAKGLSDEDIGQHKELDGEQMAAPGEGRVADAVAGRTGGVNLGGGGSQPDLAADLDRKKAEQQAARDEILNKKQENTEAGGALGQTGGPANPVDNPRLGGNYPNTGV